MAGRFVSNRPEAAIHEWRATDRFRDTSRPVQARIARHNFTGQYHYAETGLNYNYYRYYDSNTGRYISSDPIGLRGGLNTYAYVGSNPQKGIDAYGLQDFMGVDPQNLPVGALAGSSPRYQEYESFIQQMQEKERAKLSCVAKFLAGEAVTRPAGEGLKHGLARGVAHLAMKGAKKTCSLLAVTSPLLDAALVAKAAFSVSDLMHCLNNSK